MGGSKPLVKGDLHKKVTISTTGTDFDTGNDFYSLFPKGPESSIPKFTVGEKGLHLAILRTTGYRFSWTLALFLGAYRSGY